MPKFIDIDGSDLDMNNPVKVLEYLSKRSGGIPDFAKEVLINKMDFTKEEVDMADKAGRNAQQPSKTTKRTTR